MPIYEYTCRACGARFEELIRNAAEEKALRCTQCGDRRIERQMSVPAAPHAGASKTPLPSGCGQCGQTPGSCPLKG